MPLSRINAQSLATNVDLSDTQSIRFGTDNDASITHDGTNLIIDSNTGTTLYHAGQHFFKNQFGTQDHARFSSNGSAQLYHNGELRFRTTSTGLDVLAEDDDGSSDNVSNIRIIAEGTNEIVTLRSSDGVAQYISRNGDNYGTHLFQGFGTVSPSTVNMLQLTSNGHTSFQNFTISNGNLILSSGNGIDFSATSDATGMTGELLDDYEVGTWTPAFSSTNASFSYGTRSGEYVKVGRIVFVSFRITLNGSPTGTLTNTTFLTGLPITIDSTAHFGGSHVGHYFNLNKTDTDEEPVYQQQPSDTRLEIKMCGDLQGESNLTPAQMQSNFQLRSAVTYLAGS